jgi:hypothetical protein
MPNYTSKTPIFHYKTLYFTIKTTHHIGIRNGVQLVRRQLAAVKSGLQVGHLGIVLWVFEIFLGILGRNSAFLRCF